MSFECDATQSSMFDPSVIDSAPILLVDDEEDLVATYERILLRKGYPVISAHTLNDGLAVIERRPLKLLVTDVRLPDGNGLDLVRVGRQQLNPIPALVVTGFASQAGRTAALDAGAANYLAKPFGVSTFTALVENTLADKR